MREVQGILNDLKNSDWWIRKDIIKGLLDYPEDLYINVLEDWLREGDDALLRNISMEAYRALGKRSLKSLIALLREEDADVRVFAANVLGDIGDGAALPALAEALNDEDVNMRVAVAESLGKIGDERAVDSLAGALNDEPWVAMACIEAIGGIGGQRALSVLYECLGREECLDITCAAIEKAGSQYSIKYLAPHIAGGGAAGPALKAVIGIAEKEGMKLPCSFLAEMMPLLIELQSSPQDELRRAAFIALSWAEDLRGLPYFLDALNDEGLQEYAVNGLISLGKNAAADIIKALERPGDNRVILAKVLSMFGENKALLQFADDYDAEVRTEVALAIGSLETSVAEEALMALRRDPVEEVRAAALLSLKNFRKDVT